MKILSISLLIWNGKRFLPFLFNSLINQSFRDFEVFIIDNGSCDDSFEWIDKNKKFFNFSYKLIKLRKNIGFSAGHNRAISWSNSKYVMLLNQDTYLEKDYIKNIIDFLEKNFQFKSAQGKILMWDFENEDKIDDLIITPLKLKGITNIIDSLGIKIYKSHLAEELGKGLVSEDFSKNLEIFAPTGCIPIFRRESLENIKINNEYFDEDFFSYKEDVDLGYRMRILGMKSIMIPTSIAYHKRSHTEINEIKNLKLNKFFVQLKAIRKIRKSKNKFLWYISYRNHFYFLIKCIPGKILIKNFVYILKYELLKFLFIILFEPWNLKVILEILKNLPKFFKKRRIIQNQVIISRQFEEFLE